MSEPTIPGFCGHSKFVHGCPSCAYRWLKHHGLVKPSRIFNHYSGLNRMNAAAISREATSATNRSSRSAP